MKVESCSKRVRVYLGGECIAATIRSKLVWEKPHYPAYYFPAGDVRMDLLSENGRTEPSPRRGLARYFDARANDRVVSNAAWHFPESPVHDLRGHVRFDWDSMDAWFEEDEEVFVHAHDPYKRIDILHASRHVEISSAGLKLADTRRPTIVYETGAPVRYYFPKLDVRMDLFEPSERRTGCAYKGFARYWSVPVDEGRREDLAWSYPTPFAECAKIAGMVAFYGEHVDMRIDGVLQERRRADDG